LRRSPNPVGNLLAFGRLLRGLGLDVHTGRMLDVIDALLHVDIRRRDEVYHTCRALLVHRHEDFATFDRAFDAFWRHHTTTGRREAPDATDARDGKDAQDRSSKGSGRLLVEEDAGDASVRPGGARSWSDAERFAQKDFGAFSDEEVAAARAALEQLTWSPAERRTRRWVAGRGPRMDLRRALAHSLRTGGDVVTLPRRRRRLRQRPVVMLCDVSGSMDRYTRMLLHFGHAIRGRHRRVEVFVFSTQLTRVTPQLRDRRLDVAMAAASRTVPTWAGGTRIGESLRQFHRHWTRRVLHGGPVVLLVSDGWDRGDPALLREQMARLQRSSHRLIWLNPLIGTDDYAPLTRGLQAALPFVDDFLPARTLTDLRALANHLNDMQQ
jgi:uncharacterized protein with von Willebrand factor type A (vWA) domain